MKNKQHTRIKKRLALLLLFLMMLPLIQQKVQFIKLKPLKGSYSKVEKPTWSLKNWLEGEYQIQQEKYLNENIGFRNLFVRGYNQISFSWFNIARANGVVVGKDNYLYEEGYIKAYLGEDFIGDEKILSTVQKLKEVQDSLKNKHIDLVVVLAPGKGTFYPEFMPDEYQTKKKLTSNYETYVKLFGRNDVNFIDFNRWFLNLKDSTEFPLYPKCGIHWSKYGEILAADSLIKYIQKVRNVKMPQIQVSDIQSSRFMRDRDDDIEQGMNLLFNVPDLKMGYPNFTFTIDDTVQPKVLTVGDSYYWGMFNWGLSRDVFNHGQFWYYNQQIYPDSYQNPLNVSEIDIKKEVEKNDVIVLMSTDANLHKFPFGFADQLHHEYYKE